MKFKIKLSPINEQRWQRFKKNKRGYYSLIIFTFLTVLSMGSELVFNNKPLMMEYNGSYYFPIFSDVKQGKDFGLDYEEEPNYLKLQADFKKADSGNWIIMSAVPYNASMDDPIDQVPLDEEIKKIEAEYNPRIAEIEKSGGESEELAKKITTIKIEMVEKIKVYEKLKYHPLPPDASSRHFLGTDKNGRDILARIVYGYRIAITFSLILLFLTFVVGTLVGCLMGYVGGWFDLLFQRVIEVISNIPFLYIVIIIAAIMIDKDKQLGFFSLIGIFAIFGWTGITWYMRTATYKEKSREYIMAAKAMGASNSHVVLSHIIPNVISLLVTFVPFAVSGNIVSLTALDYLGYGLPKGYPSWGELIKQGTENMEAYWVISSVVAALVIVLFLINSVGEAVREAFDPKKISRYE